MGAQLRQNVSVGAVDDMLAQAKGIAPSVLRILERSASSRVELCKATGKDERIVRAAIAELRKTGHLVVGDSSRYWLSNDWGEVFSYTASIKQQLVALMAVLVAMEDAAVNRLGIGNRR